MTSFYHQCTHTGLMHLRLRTGWATPRLRTGWTLSWSILAISIQLNKVPTTMNLPWMTFWRLTICFQNCIHVIWCENESVKFFGLRQSEKDAKEAKKKLKARRIHYKQLKSFCLNSHHFIIITISFHSSNRRKKLVKMTRMMMMMWKWSRPLPVKLLRTRLVWATWRQAILPMIGIDNEPVGSI